MVYGALRLLTSRKGSCEDGLDALRGARGQRRGGGQGPCELVSGGCAAGCPTSRVTCGSAPGGDSREGGLGARSWSSNSLRGRAQSVGGREGRTSHIPSGTSAQDGAGSAEVHALSRRLGEPNPDLEVLRIPHTHMHIYALVHTHKQILRL